MGLCGTNEGKERIMKRRWVFILGLFLVVVSGVLFYRNQELELKLAENEEEVRQFRMREEELEGEKVSLESEIVNLREEKTRLEEEVIFFREEEIDSGQQNVWNHSEVGVEEGIENGFAERIRRNLSGYDMEKVGVWLVGEDSLDHMKRFFLCCDSVSNKKSAEFYVADYVTGKIYNLNFGVPRIDIAYCVWKDGDWKRGTFDWEVFIEDLDGNGMEDILFVVSEDLDWNQEGGIFLWMQGEDGFCSINRVGCGKLEKAEENIFSQQIAKLEETFRKEQKPEKWDAKKIAIWVKEELFYGREEELSKLLSSYHLQNDVQDGKEENIEQKEKNSVTLLQDANEEYRVSIPENPYSEKRINIGLQKFYEDQVEEENEFFGVGREDNSINFTEKQARLFGFRYSMWIKPYRVDDAIISFRNGDYRDYGASGSPHGLSRISSINFDTETGRYLELADVFPDKEGFGDFVIEYIEKNYNAYSPELSMVKSDILTNNGCWCMSGYGIEIACVNQGNGFSYSIYSIPYEYLTDFIKSKYLPISKEAECSLSKERVVEMDVNHDGVLDRITYLLQKGEITINETTTTLMWKGEPLAREGISLSTECPKLVRDKDGITQLEWKGSIFQKSDQQEEWVEYVFVYRVEGEVLVLEEASALFTDLRQDRYEVKQGEEASVLVEVVQDEKEHYLVQISGNSDSEEKINHWLLEFYQTDEEERAVYLGIGIVESDVSLTEKERKDAGYSYHTLLEVMRADEAVISFSGHNFTRPGRITGGYLPNIRCFSVNFDSKSGEILQPEDIFSDMEGFCGFAAGYLEENFGEDVRDRVDVEERFFGNGWCMTSDEVVLFQNYGMVTGGKEYPIPYECIADYIKTEYLPLS